jgi:hypothetical protein
VAVDRVSPDHVDVVDPEDVVNGGCVPSTLLLQIARRLLSFGRDRELLRVGLDLLQTIAILLCQLVGRHGLAVLLDEAAIATLARQARVHLEYLDGLALRSSRGVQPLLDTAFVEAIAALALLVRREVRPHLRGKCLVIGKRPLLWREGPDQRQ